MPINFGEIFIPKGKNSKQQAPVSLESHSSVDGKEKFVINLPKQFVFSPEKQTADVPEQNRKIPWSTIPFLKPIQLPKEDVHEQNKKSVPIGSDAIKWTTTTKVRQKKKELNMFSPTSF